LIDLITYVSVNLTLGLPEAKLFDCVHTIIPPALKLLKHQYYTNTGAISYKNGNKCCSEWKEIQYGVPQGSVLGPVLFLLYINDLPNITSDLSKPVLFADDTSILISDKDPINFKIKINKLFDMINEWFTTNLLVINYEKTCFLQFQTKNSKMLDIQLNYLNNQIPSSSIYRF
jgi:hypothetical protein